MISTYVIEYSVIDPITVINRLRMSLDFPVFYEDVNEDNFNIIIYPNSEFEIIVANDILKSILTASF